MTFKEYSNAEYDMLKPREDVTDGSSGRVWVKAITPDLAWHAAATLTAIDRSFVGPTGSAKEQEKTDVNELIFMCAHDPDFNNDVGFEWVEENL